VTRPVVVQLLGYPGTGKYTVAKELVRQMEAAGRPARLLDNHASANLVLSLVPTPTRGIPDDVMERIVVVREAVLDTLRNLTPRDWSIVFTNFPPTMERALHLERNRQLAEDRGSVFVPVVLECDPDEIVRRVVAPERGLRHKLVDPVRAREVLAQPLPLPPWDDIHRLDVTSRSPADAARAILAILKDPPGA
jgi:predicted kinase